MSLKKPKKNSVVDVSENKIKKFLKKFYIPPANSHKGENGKLLVIGGSSLFHAASIWAARVSSYFVDIVHYSSCKENNRIMLSIKKRFMGGIVIPREELLGYVEEDDCVLIGPGMIRGNISDVRKKELLSLNFDEILNLQKEEEFSYALTFFLISNFPSKKFVIDAGALQMLDPSWLANLEVKPILTPHTKEYERVFGKLGSNFYEKLKETAQKNNCVILLKKKDDFVTDGEKIYRISGGNAGLTKGGSGDVLAGLVAAFYTKNNALTSSILASFILKKTAEKLFKTKAYWYNIDDIIDTCPKILAKFFNAL